MPSEIERAFYGNRADRVSSDGHVGEHSLVEFSISRDISTNSDILRLVVAPDDRENVDLVAAVFRRAHLGFIQQPDFDPEFNYLPWGIIGVLCKETGEGKSSFQLNCEVIRIQWTSDWPEIHRGG